jgi:hypothetical protein
MHNLNLQYSWLPLRHYILPLRYTLLPPQSHFPKNYRSFNTSILRPGQHHSPLMTPDDTLLVRLLRLPCYIWSSLNHVMVWQEIRPPSVNHDITLRQWLAVWEYTL